MAARAIFLKLFLPPHTAVSIRGEEGVIGVNNERGLALLFLLLLNVRVL